MALPFGVSDPFLDLGMLPLLSVATPAAVRVVPEAGTPLAEFCLEAEDGGCCLCFGCKWFLKMSSEHLSAN